jgi:hypothetical protein
MKIELDPNLKIVKMNSYPEDYMDILYNPGTLEVFQIVYVCPFGYFTRMAGKWRALGPRDTTLESLSAVHVSSKDRKAVRDLFDEAQVQGKVLKYKDVEKYAIYYSFELEEDPQ